jgi:hypothetical protein
LTPLDRRPKTEDRRPKTEDRRPLWFFGFLILPFVIYTAVAYKYFQNVPYWDDFSVVLTPVNSVFATYNVGEQITTILKPNAGHIPAITRIISILQVKYLGGINFRGSLFAANFGWLLTAIMLIVYFRRTLSLSWLALLPVPFLLLNINHWESMDFITPAWQMYWGSAFFPALFFIAVVEKRMTVAVFAFTFSLFLSSGALPLYPLAIVYCLFRKRWSDGISFAFRAAIPLLVFFFFNPPSGSVSKAPDFILMTKYIPAFMGNIVSTGTWDMTSIAWLQIPIGLIVIALGLYMLLKSNIGDFSKLIFLYVLLLGGMAAYLRGAGFGYVVSRYALFASLAVTCIYAIYASEIQNSSLKIKKWFLPTASIISVLLWAHSIYICQTPLALNMEGRIKGIETYIHPEQPATQHFLVWDVESSRPIIEEAKTWHVYDPADAKK